MKRKTKEVWDNANLLSFNFHVLLTLSSQLSVFSKLCIINALMHFLLRQSCLSLRNVSLGLIKTSYHVGYLSVMTSSEGPLFSLASDLKS